MIQTQKNRRYFMKKALVLILSLSMVLTSVLLTGCGGTSTATDTSAATSTTATTATPEKAKPVTLKLWWGDSDSNKAIMLEGINAYRDINPNVKIEASWLADANDPKKLQVAIASNSAPDIVRLDCVDVPSFGFKKQLVDMSALGADEIKDQFLASCWAANTYKDKAYALPFDANTIGFMYNKDILDKAGVQPPKTYQDIINVANAVKKLNLDKTFGYTLPIQSGGTGWLAFQYCFWIWREGGEILNADWTKATYNSPEGVEALQKILDLRDKYGVLTKDSYLEPDFYLGKGAMLDMGCWAVPTITGKDKKANFGIAPMPTLKEGVPGYSGLGLYSVAVVSSSKAPKEAYEFLKYFCTNKDFQIEWAKKTNLMPTLTAAYEDPYFKTPEWTVFLEQLKIAKSRPGTPAWNQIADHMSVAIQEALSGAKPVKQALDDAVAKSNAALDKVNN